MVLLNTKTGKDYFDYNIENRKDFTNNLLLNYNLDPKNVLEIMTNNSLLFKFNWTFLSTWNWM